MKSWPMSAMGPGCWVLNGPDALEMRCPLLSRKQTSIGLRRKVGFGFNSKIFAYESDDPIPTPKGKPLVNLRDAAAYIMALPKKEADTAEWQPRSRA